MPASSNEKLVQVKLKLAEKYERLRLLTPSTPRAKTYLLRAARYRRQAEQLKRT